MKSVYDTIVISMLLLLIGDPVISGRLVIDTFPGINDLLIHINYFDNFVTTDHNALDSPYLFLLFCSGFVGIILVARKNTGYRYRGKDRTP